MRRFHYGNEVIQYSVVKSKRIKTSELFVDAKGVLIRTPQDKPDKEIAQIIKRKVDWILKQQRHYRQLQNQFLKPTFEDGSTLPYLGQARTLHIIAERKTTAIRFVSGEFLVTVKSKKYTKRQIETLYNAWLLEKAKTLLTNKVNKYARIIKVKPRKIIIKKVQRRLGSATKNNIINLNFQLVKAPEEIIDYVVIHELCHLRIRNHSHHFWDLLHRFVPDYDEKLEWLKTNGFLLS